MGERRLPPGPSDWALGMSLVGRIKADLLGFYADARRRYGDAVSMRLGPYRDFVFFHPDQVREVLVEKARDFVRMERPLQVMAQWNGQGLIITEGETWLRHRRLLQPAFARARLGGYAAQVVAAAAAALDGLAGTAEFEPAMTDLATAVICRTMFGTDLGAARDEVRRAVAVLADVAMREMFAPFTLPDWLPLPGKAAKRAAMATLDRTVRGFIRERRAAGGDRGDLLSMLLLAADEEGDGRRLTDEQARDQCVTTFLAGHDTTAAGLTWLGWVLASEPDVAARAAAEVDAALGGRPPTFDDLPRLAFVERVVKETLRRYPPAVAVLARKAVRDVEVGGWTVPKGAIVRIMTHVIHHDPRWFPEPERIDPDRFAPGRAEGIPPGAYLPFGLGPRACIGAQLAMTEMTLVAAMLLQRFTLAPADGPPLPRPGMSLRPAGGLRLRLTPRHLPSA